VSPAAWRLDAAVAVVAAILVIVLAPGLAWVGLAALLVLLVCGASVLVERFGARRRGRR
jgi:hypothetical protein